MVYGTRSASLRAALLAASISSVFVSPLAPAQNQDFVPGPSNPEPPYPSELVAQPNPALQQLPPVPMPQDRAAASYSIYTVMLPVGELADPGWPRDLWLLSDTTISLVPADQPCLPQADEAAGMNPHVAVQPPAGNTQDYAELLEDFDRRCHERVHLTADNFNLVVPLRLLNPTEQDEFIRTRFDPNGGRDADIIAAHYKGAPGLSRFSEVYFNAHQTVAMVYASGWCGGLCAQSYWQVLGFDNGTWKRLSWRTAYMTN
jgi:hypothetical protein